MRTKVIILGGSLEESPKKSIEFVKFLGTKELIYDTSVSPNMYKNIELICFKYSEKHDLMFAYNENRSNGVLYLGHFNDGVIE